MIARRGPPPPEALAILEAHERRERERRESFGQVRPIISTEFEGRRIVAVGNTIHWSATWKTFPDFLLDYIKKTLGSEWGNAELEKPLEERHPILQWYDALCLLQQRTKEESAGDAEGIYASTLDGPSRAYLVLAYDLYVLRDHLALQESLVKRLRHPDQFQGARYELFVASTMIRAGFRLEYEDETDPSSRHPEFRARHRELGDVVSVEAKSRHRPGVLGRPRGSDDAASDFRLGIDRLFRDALRKAPDHPYVIFVDANMPPEVARRLGLGGWQGEVLAAIARSERERREQEESYPGRNFIQLYVTNTPDHYGEAGEPSPGDLYYSVTRENAAELDHPEVLGYIETALSHYGSVPQHFPED